MKLTFRQKLAKAFLRRQYIDVTVYIGLPGSGKTTMMEDMIKHNTEERIVSYGIDDVNTRFEAFSSVLKVAMDGSHVLCTDPMATQVPPMKVASVINDIMEDCASNRKINKLTLVYIRPDVEGCIEAVQERKQNGDERDISISTIRTMAQTYTNDQISDWKIEFAWSWPFGIVDKLTKIDTVAIHIKPSLRDRIAAGENVWCPL